MRRAFLLLFLVLAAAACDAKDHDLERIQKRAAGLRWLPLPATGRAGEAKGVFVNSLVPRILVSSAPAGAEVRAGATLLGTTPVEIETRLLLTDDPEAPTPLTFAVDGAAARVKAYALHYEAALVHEGVSQDSLPAPLPSRDLWLHVVVEKRP